MTKQHLKDAFGWGFALWFFGYILGILLFMVVPTTTIGWIIMPLGVLITLWVLEKKIKTGTFQYFIWLGVVWTLIAIICDYFFLVRLFNPDAYYTLDVNIYYTFTFVLPLIVGWRKNVRS